MPATKRKWTLLIIILAIIFGGTFAYHILRGILIEHFIAKMFQTTPSVGTTVATKQTWRPSLSAVGSLQAVHGVEVNSQAGGQITAIYFESGQTVSKGQPLFQLDDAVDRQTLLNDMAHLQVNKADYDRKVEVYKQNGISKTEVEAAKVLWLASQAAVETAKLNIAFKQVKAPFAGRVGIRKVDIGQYITPGQDLVTLQSLDPLYVDFNIPEQNLSQLAVGLPVSITVDAYPKKTFVGKITAISPLVDSSTRTILTRATISNKDDKLYPGLFADVEITLPNTKQVIVIPQTAVDYSLYGNTVYVIEQKGKDSAGPIYVATQRFVELGDRKGNDIAVISGVKEGDEVVVSGQIKLQPGARVTKMPVKLDS